MSTSSSTATPSNSEKNFFSVPFSLNGIESFSNDPLNIQGLGFFIPASLQCANMLTAETVTRCFYLSMGLFEFTKIGVDAYKASTAYSIREKLKLLNATDLDPEKRCILDTEISLNSEVGNFSVLNAGANVARTLGDTLAVHSPAKPFGDIIKASAELAFIISNLILSRYTEDLTEAKLQSIGHLSNMYPEALTVDENGKITETANIEETLLDSTYCTKEEKQIIVELARQISFSKSKFWKKEAQNTYGKNLAVTNQKLIQYLLSKGFECKDTWLKEQFKISPSQSECSSPSNQEEGNGARYFLNCILQRIKSVLFNVNFQNLVVYGTLAAWGMSFIGVVVTGLILRTAFSFMCMSTAFFNKNKLNKSDQDLKWLKNLNSILNEKTDEINKIKQDRKDELNKLKAKLEDTALFEKAKNVVRCLVQYSTENKEMLSTERNLSYLQVAGEFLFRMGSFVGKCFNGGQTPNLSRLDNTGILVRTGGYSAELLNTVRKQFGFNSTVETSVKTTEINNISSTIREIIRSFSDSSEYDKTLKCLLESAGFEKDANDKSSTNDLLQMFKKADYEKVTDYMISENIHKLLNRSIAVKCENRELARDEEQVPLISQSPSSSVISFQSLSPS